MKTKSVHVPVLLNEVLEYLNADDGLIFLDCTFGGGGHSKAILDANARNIVFAIDRDKRAVERGEMNFSNYSDRFQIAHGNFSKVSSIFENQKFDAILADLGLSSDQLDEGRGFSFNDSDSLDMRMNEDDGISAESIVNESSLRELIGIFRAGGVGQDSKRYASAILNSRPIKSSKRLSDVIEASATSYAREKTKRPATTVLQSLRIAVNDEFKEIKQFLEEVPRVLSPRGRLGVISFHSLEDKLVAKKMRSWEQGDTSPALVPNPDRKKSKGKLLTKKAVEPSDAEISQNVRSRSARLRVFEFRKEEENV